MVQEYKKPIYMQNRELSWLKFNERVLDEAIGKTVPLLERLKFISIFNTNLDEFFMVRVGRLFDMNDIDPMQIDKKSGLTANEQIEEICKEVRPLYAKKEEFFNKVIEDLREYNVNQLKICELNVEQRKLVKQYFVKAIKPMLSPLIVNARHPFLHMENKRVHIIANLSVKNKENLAIIPIPTSLPNAFYLSESNEVTYILVEDIILEFANLIFENCQVSEKLKIRVTRNTDIDMEDYDVETDIDYRAKMRKNLIKRKRLAPVRLEVSEKLSERAEKYFLDKLSLTKQSLFVTSTPMDLGFVFSMYKKLSKNQQELIEYTQFKPSISPNIDMSKSILRQVRNKDIMLSYPFESIAPFLRMVKEAANDEHVLSIKITIYRLSSNSKLVEYLCQAAENGKEVTILIELRARFDEQNNIDWSERLEEAGCNVTYGVEGYKVHSKLCLITRREKGEIRYYTQVGTGNYNEKTTKQYTDISIMTYNQEIGHDANIFFQNMGIDNLDVSYKHLLVAPNGFKNKILELIAEQAHKAENGHIFMKMNSLTDYEIIRALRDASNKGTKVELIIRGICCLIPGLDDQTENITVTSIVGRFLEHSRIYSFGLGEKMYIASADCMTRNMEHRVEVACPILDADIKAKVQKIIDLCLADDTKAMVLLENGRYIKKNQTSSSINSQEIMLDMIEEKREVSQTESLIDNIYRILEKFKSR